MELPLVFHFKRSAAEISGTLDSPSQGMLGMNFDSVEMGLDGTLRAVVDKLKAHYDGTLDSEKHEIRGTWYQGAVQVPLNMKSVARYEPPRRPQTPVAPFPYKNIEMTINSDGCVLSGTLSLPPESNKPLPCVILIHGSGPHDRDETMFEHKPFLVISDYLVRQGFAVLRYDKRGCGKSTGKYREASSKNFADDARQAVLAVKALPQIDGRKIGLLGHSEGGVVAPMVAQDCSNVSFIISLAGSVLSGEQILLSQTEALGRGQGASKEKREKMLAIARETYKIIKSQPDNKLAIDEVKAMRKANDADEYELLENKRKEADGAIEESLKMMTGPWYRFFLTFDPREAWSKVKCPVLALNGALDQQVIAKENLPEIKSALQKAGNSQCTCETIPGVNHLFQECKTGMPDEYAKIEETISPKVLQIISNWLKALLK
jgi:pimeloyl-ACP methyl ester carboxylesterase